MNAWMHRAHEMLSWEQPKQDAGHLSAKALLVQSCPWVVLSRVAVCLAHTQSIQSVLQALEHDQRAALSGMLPYKCLPIYLCVLESCRSLHVRKTTRGFKCVRTPTENP